MTRNQTTTSDSRRRGQRAASLLKRERELWTQGVRRVAGVDEVGVGPLAGPVVAAAVIFEPGSRILGVDDSKKLSAARREALAAEIRELAAAWAVVRVEPEEIDRINVLQASLAAMRRAVLELDPAAEHVLVDGRAIPQLSIAQETWIKGDARCFAIAAASILAKTSRDAMMQGYDDEFPGYGFASHKGYPTPAHRDAIRRLGPSPIHRQSFTLLPQKGLFD
jgi:ribonuclease HII